jgi:hypothetical protein
MRFFVGPIPWGAIRSALTPSGKSSIKPNRGTGTSSADAPTVSSISLPTSETQVSVTDPVSLASGVERGFISEGEPHLAVQDDVRQPVARQALSAIETQSWLDEAQKLEHEISQLYSRITMRLRERPQEQTQCLEHLKESEMLLARATGRADLIQARWHVTQVKVLLARNHANQFSAAIVPLILYLFIAGIWALATKGILTSGASAEEMNEQLLMGIPIPVFVWSGIGSLTSMLLKAGSTPFDDRSEALRWLFSRPIVGLVMGILIYLMIVAGLIVFAGTADLKTPQLIWVLAFVGGFSDTLSVGLMGKLDGQFRPPAAKIGPGRPADLSIRNPAAPPTQTNT